MRLILPSATSRFISRLPSAAFFKGPLEVTGLAAVWEACFSIRVTDVPISSVDLPIIRLDDGTYWGSDVATFLRERHHSQDRIHETDSDGSSRPGRLCTGAIASRGHRSLPQAPSGTGRFGLAEIAPAV
jgi:hypothetical protein